MPLPFIRIIHFATLTIACLITASCVSKPVDRAFAGKMGPDEAKRTIVEYCQTCHTHRNFNAAEHLGQVSEAYKAEPYTSANDCQTCHSMKRNFWDDVIRTTHYPGGRLVGDQ